ncbi:MAG: formylglycine-generating enzyme family protein [Pirellula sp.]
MRRELLLFVAAVSMATASMVSTVQAAVVSFGSGINAFSMEFVTIGNPGNAADTTGNPNPAGAVAYTYGIGKFEVSRDIITKFNASQSLKISLADMTSYGGNGANKPATGVNWNEAARFVNWLNTSKGGFAAYKFTTDGVNDDIALWTVADTLDYDPLNLYRSKRATYVLPSYNEWYKAAYYNPNDSTFYDFPNGSNTAPLAISSGTTAGTAVYNHVNQASFIGPADVNQAGGLSPYGVMGLGGNVYEWEESSIDLANSSGSSPRGIRGGAWAYISLLLSSSVRGQVSDPGHALDYVDFGFRVASLSSSTPPCSA